MAVMDIIIKAQDKASQVMEDIKSKGSKASETLKENWGKIGLAAGAAGLAIEGLARSQAELNEKTRKLSGSTGINEKAMRSLALETTNVTFPLEDVLDLFETGRQRGLKSGEALQEYATFWDTVGDATGESATELGKAGVALEAVGVSAGNEKEALAAFGYVSQETTSTVGDFLKFLERTGPQLRELGLDVNDSAALLGILEHEFGMSGRTARSEFRKAVNEADGDLNKMMDSLGISEDMFDSYRGKVEDSSDVIQRNADIHADSYTPIEKLQQKVSEITYKYGDLLQAASALSPILMGLGAIMPLLTAAKDAYTVATNIASVAARGFGTAMRFAMGPLGLIVTAIGLAIAAGIALYKNWDEVKEFLGNVWEGIKNIFWSAVEWIANVTGQDFDELKERILLIWNTVWGSLSDIWELIKGTFFNAIDFLKALVTGDFEGMREIIGNQMELARDKIGSILDRFKELFNEALRWITDKVGLDFDETKNTIKNALETARGIISDVWNFIKNTFKNALDFLKALVTGDFQGMKDAINNQMENARGLLGSIWDRIKSMFGDKLANIVSTVKRKFNEAKNRVLSPIREAKNKVKGIIDDIKGFFSRMKLKLPKIKMPKLPHFSLKGSFSLMPPRVPKLSVKWYQRGGVFDDASVIGVGEAGPEAVVPLRGSHMVPFAREIASQMGSGGSSVDIKAIIKEVGRAVAREIATSISQIAPDYVVVHVQLDGRTLVKATAEMMTEEQQRLSKHGQKARGIDRA